MDWVELLSVSSMHSQASDGIVAVWTKSNPISSFQVYLSCVAAMTTDGRCSVLKASNMSTILVIHRMFTLVDFESLEGRLLCSFSHAPLLFSELWFLSGHCWSRVAGTSQLSVPSFSHTRIDSLSLEWFRLQNLNSTMQLMFCWIYSFDVGQAFGGCY